ncbi:ras-related protein Rab-13-like isoform X3 [Ptychodera flava]|uniref:ras-related protein Rab-13-like isoform X3 n=1 Tax=Ptychodera flava TaxID=63121 RepID=UPI003969F807
MTEISEAGPLGADSRSVRDLTFKVLVLGDSDVGKTCLVNQFCESKFYESYVATIGLDFKYRTVILENTNIRLQVWDTAGQERFRTLTTAYYRGATGILLVYDITNSETFLHLTGWLENIKQNASSEVCIVIVGNRSDRQVNREVRTERATQLAQSYELELLETSAKTNHNVEHGFRVLANQMLMKNKQRINRKDNVHQTIHGSELYNSGDQSSFTSGCRC